jgi:hypothetical protein
LNRRDGTAIGRRDPLLQIAHLRGKVRLISDRGRHAPQQCRYFGTGLREPENIVDEEQNVLSFFIAEILSHSYAS